jgi:hypothetical protein
MGKIIRLAKERRGARSILCCWCCSLLLLGCDGGGSAAKSSKNDGKDRVTTIEKVSVKHFMPKDVLSFSAFVSPDGSRTAVKRNVSDRMNVHLYNFEVDDKAAPQSFDEIDGPRWSANGKSFVYVGRNYKPQPTQHFFVHEATVYGPYPNWRAMAISLDGTTSCMAYSAPDPVKNVMTHTLVLNGTATPIAFDPKEIRFDAKNAPVLKHPDGKWVDATGATAQEPPDPEQQPVAVPKVPVTMTHVKGPDRKQPKRAVLSVNGKNVGDFDAVLGSGGADGSPRQFGFLQPDGRTFVYVVDGNNLDRLWFRF